MADIFISYARADLSRMLPIARALQAAGYSVWYDASLKAGQSFGEVIAEELKAATCVVVVWSHTSIKRRWVRSEAGAGLSREILVPVLIDAAELPLPFDTVHTPDLSAWRGETDDPQWRQVMEAVADLCGPREAPGPEHAPAPAPATQNTDQWSAPGPALAATPPQQAGLRGKDLEVFRDADAPWCPQMVVIPAGRFLMGSPVNEQGREGDEGPQHEVSVPGFALGRYPVTFDEFDAFCRETGRQNLAADEGWGRGRRPVIHVSWHDAQAFCAFLSEKTTEAYRLPSEAEWEYACRAGTTTRYWFGEGEDRLKGHAWFLGNAGRMTQPVGADGHANPWGLSDMHGNVYEWCADCWNNSYGGLFRRAPTNGSAWTSGNCDLAVVRGGSWGNYPRNIRAAIRIDSNRVNGSSGIGFRVARTLPR